MSELALESEECTDAGSVTNRDCCPTTAASGRRFAPPCKPIAHLASLREPRFEAFPVGAGRNKLKVRLGIRNLAALPPHGQDARFGHGAVAVRVAAIGGHAVGGSDLSHDYEA